MAEPVEVFELVVVCCLPVASSFQSRDKPAPSRQLQFCRAIFAELVSK